MKKIKNKCIIFVGLLILVSCINEHAKFIENLTNNEVKYWDMKAKIYKSGRKANGGKYSLKFAKNGDFCFYTIDDGKRTKFEYQDIVSSYKWEFIQPDTLVFDSSKYKIVKLSKDTLILLNYSKDKFIYTVGHIPSK